MNVELNQFVIQMLPVQIHLGRLNANAIRDMLVMDLYVMVRKYSSFYFLWLIWFTYQHRIIHFIA